MLMPAISCIVVSHNKPDLLLEAVESVRNQSWTDWQAIVVDSGVLYDRDFFSPLAWTHDPRFTLIRSTETEEQRRTTAMAPWCFNECFRRGWVKGRLVMYLCDDDILYPNTFATFLQAFEECPEALAIYASQDLAEIGADGVCHIVGERRASEVGGQCVDGCGSSRTMSIGRKVSTPATTPMGSFSNGSVHWRRSCHSM
jgi:spore maturation protein CgeD